MKKTVLVLLFLYTCIGSIQAQQFKPFSTHYSGHGYYNGENEKTGVMNKNGKAYTPAMYDAVSEIQEGLIRVELNGKTGFVDTTNRVIIPFEYDIDTLFFTNNRYLQTLVSFDQDGKESTKSLVYTHSRSYYNGFSDGLCAVVKDGKYGFIDKGNKVVIPFIYEAADNFRNDEYAIVMKNGKQGLIRKNGDEVVPFAYDEIFWNESFMESDAELLVFKSGTKEYLKIQK